MHSIIEEMLAQHESTTLTDKKNSIKEVVQEIILCGLSRSGFFKEAAFYGGTALRIFYGLDRFSEDLDFSLMAPDQDFSLDGTCHFLKGNLVHMDLNSGRRSKRKLMNRECSQRSRRGIHGNTS